MEKRRPSIVDTITPLQGDAWAAYNAAYYANNAGAAEAYRTVGAQLYRAANHEKVEKLFAQLDEQNRILDMVPKGKSVIVFEAVGTSSK